VLFRRRADLLSAHGEQLRAQARHSQFGAYWHARSRRVRVTGYAWIAAGAYMAVRGAWLAHSPWYLAGVITGGSWVAAAFIVCGHASCRCHADPPRLHGPYHQWTRKKVGKTATRILSDDQLADYSPWFDNHRRLRELLTELEELSLAITEADPAGSASHTARQAAPPQPAEPEHQPPDRVGSTRLT